MSKKIVMYLLMSLVATIVASAGSFTCKGSKDEDITETGLLAITHPEDCTLLEPQSLPLSVGTGSTLVRVKPGKTTFVWDCNGKQLTIDHDFKTSDHLWTFKPAEAKGL